MKIKRIFGIALIGFTLPFVFWSFTSKKKLSLEGTWNFVEVRNVKKDGTSTSVYPTESLAIFSKNAYSFTWTTHEEQNRSWQISDSSKISRFNKSLINAGTYVLKDAHLTTIATFAMNPMFTEGEANFQCSFKGDTLLLTGLNVYSSDKVIHPIYAGGSHFVNKLVRTNNMKNK